MRTARTKYTKCEYEQIRQFDKQMDKALAVDDIPSYLRLRDEKGMIQHRAEQRTQPKKYIETVPVRAEALSR